MLDFCKEIFNKLQTPWISLDVCYDGNAYHLIEFQGISLGPTILVNAPYYFMHGNNNTWQKFHEKSDLSTEYAQSFVQHVKNLTHP
jgi:hypothetical protein